MGEKERFDTELDKNGDNSLNKEEILEWIIPSNEDVAKEEVDHLFAGADADMDDVLKFEEIIKNHELFVGSEATDYGDHLKNLHRFEEIVTGVFRFVFCLFCHLHLPYRLTVPQIETLKIYI